MFSKSVALNQPTVRAKNFDCRKCYRIQIKQKLKLEGMRKHKIMHQWFCNKIDAVQDFMTTSGFQTRQIFCCRVMWTQTTSSGEAYPLQKPLHSLKCTAWVAISKHGIIGLFWFKDNMSIVWQSTLNMFKCFVSSGQHLVNGKRSSGIVSGSSSTVPPHTPQKNHWHG